MRWLLALAALLLIPAAAAQYPWGDPTFTDPADDVMMRSAAGDQAAPAGTGSDLLAVWVIENPFHLRFQAQLADLEGDATEAPGPAHIMFTIVNQTFVVQMARSGDTEGGFFGNLFTVGAAGQWQNQGLLRVYGDVAAGTMWTSVERERLRPQPSIDLQAGTVIEDVHAWTDTTGTAVTWRDQAPDDGAVDLPPLTWVREASEGPVRLSANDAFRTSNGEATTYRFTVRADNSGEEELRLRLSAHDAPPEWNITLPGDVLRLPPGERAWFRIFVDTPFNHVHGETDAFMLRLEGVDDALVWSELQLGVDYLAIPHPAGHHDTMHVHSHPWNSIAAVANPVLGGSGGYLTMNTMQDDPSDAGIPMEARGGFNLATVHAWDICLDPGLAMGLDFDLDGVGSLQLSIEAQRPMQAVQLAGRFVLVPQEGLGPWCDAWSVADDDKTALAHLAADLGDLTPAQQVDVEAEILPDAAGDYLPYESGSQLVLELRLTSPTPQPGGSPPLLLPGGTMQLPLHEYHERTGLPAFESEAASGQDPPVTEGEFAAVDEGAEEAVAVPVFGLLAALAVLVAGRRRR